jgi:hypothetical protein
MMERSDQEMVTFNINAQLYENQKGELAVRITGEKVFRMAETMGGEKNFVDDAQTILRDGEIPEGWSEMEPRELVYGEGWNHVSSMGYINGEVEKPGIELEVPPEELGAAARRYLGDIFH